MRQRDHQVADRDVAAQLAGALGPVHDRVDRALHAAHFEFHLGFGAVERLRHHGAQGADAFVGGLEDEPLEGGEGVRLLGEGGLGPLCGPAHHRQGDLADQASGNNEVHIQLKLKQTDAKILQAIEEALYRMEKGGYGICRDCGDPISAARLEAIPWTRVCIECKQKQSS